MPIRQRWLCHAVNRSFHRVPDVEMQQRLADVARVLLQRGCQLRDRDKVFPSDSNLSTRGAPSVFPNRKDCA